MLLYVASKIAYILKQQRLKQGGSSKLLSLCSDAKRDLYIDAFSASVFPDGVWREPMGPIKMASMATYAFFISSDFDAR